MFTAAAPALAAIPAAIIALRPFPLLARWLLRVAGLRRGVIAYVGLARAARTSLTSVLPAFALVLVLAVAAFRGMVRGAISRGEVAASWQQTGADATIDTLDASLPLSVAARRAVAAVPGVQRTAVVTMTSGTGTSGTQLAIALVSPREYAALIAATPGGPAFPAAALAEPAGTRPGPSVAAPALATPAAAAALGGRDATLALGDIAQPVRIRVAGTTRAGPAIAAQASGPLLVLPRRAVPGAVHEPNLLLAAGPHLDGTRLAAVAARLLPGSRVRLRSAALAALQRQPLPRAIYTAYLAGIGVAGAFGIVVLLMSLLLTAASREPTLARLAAMGLSAGQASWLVLTEALPQIVVAIACGTGCAWALTALVGPDLNLAAFTGSGAGVGIRAGPAVLAVTAAVALAVAVATLSGQALVAGRRGVAHSVRIGE